MAAEPHPAGLLDTGVIILRNRVEHDALPQTVAISAITLAELSAGPHLVRARAGRDEAAERARRTEVLQRVEHEFDPIPFDDTAARAYGRVAAAVAAAGRVPRSRTADLMIAATALAAGLPLYTTDPDDFAGLEQLLTIVPVPISSSSG
jgi:predicted nucleic acid-binding protein